ncbi:signal recognition particle receptor subunit alpha [bacterium]|nr:signal recognition particle receptor subunit alpha [bacterium]
MFNFFKKKDEPQNKQSAFDFLKNALSKTADSLVNNVVQNISGEVPDEFELEDIETNLIKADLGVDLALELVEKIKTQKIKSSELKNFLKTQFSEILNTTGENSLKYDKNKLNIYFVVGVNGAGKTTLIGKLAHKFKNMGEKVYLSQVIHFVQPLKNSLISGLSAQGLIF